MKNTFLKITAVTMSAVMLLAFRGVKTSSINGKITPAVALKDVWVVSPTDTVRAIVLQGSFTVVNVKAGTYKVIINAAEPYKDVIVEGINVMQGQPVDIGEIKLQK